MNTPVGAGVDSKGNVAIIVGLAVSEATVGNGVEAVTGGAVGNGVTAGVGGRDPPCNSRNFIICAQKAASSSLTSRFSAAAWAI